MISQAPDSHVTRSVVKPAAAAARRIPECDGRHVQALAPFAESGEYLDRALALRRAPAVIPTLLCGQEGQVRTRDRDAKTTRLHQR